MAFQRRKRSIKGDKAPYPGFIEPILAEQVERPPRGERWVHEVKFDGYRAQLHLINEDRKVFTRRGIDWTRRFKKVADDAYQINAGSAIIDGEIVVPGEGGKTDFAELQKSLRGDARNLVMVAFHLLYLDGVDLRKRPLIERKAELKKLIAGTAIEFSEDLELDAMELFRRVCAGGLEGVVSKLADSPYASGRTGIWTKVTCAQRETLAIGGYKVKDGRFDGLYLGRREGERLAYAGKVEHGFERTDTRALRAKLDRLKRVKHPFSERIPNRGTWAEPKLLAEIEYRARSANGRLRHPVFKGLREDL